MTVTYYNHLIFVQGHQRGMCKLCKCQQFQRRLGADKCDCTHDAEAHDKTPKQSQSGLKRGQQLITGHVEENTHVILNQTNPSSPTGTFHHSMQMFLCCCLQNGVFITCK